MTALNAAYGADRVRLATAMAIELQRAAGDLPPTKKNPTDLYYRFIAWTR